VRVDKPNILMIICHDLGQNLGCYGQKYIKSPNIDKIAGKGVVFSNHFCASTPCSPSRGCIMTGRYAHSNGLMGLVNLGWNLPAKEKTIPYYLNKAGYETYLFGFQHERKDPMTAGYKHVYKGPQWCDDVSTNVIKFLKSAEAKKRPFYINAGFFEVHLPFNRKVYKPADPKKVEVPGYLPDNKDVREELSRFYGSIEFMDKSVGKILDTLKNTGFEKNTIVIFTTDHGMAFPRAKSTLYDSGIETALVMRWKDKIKEKIVQPELINNIDLMPTILEIAGCKIPRNVQGKSFLGLLEGRKYKANSEIYSEKNFHDEYDPIRSVRTERFKYIRSYEDASYASLPADIKVSCASRSLPAKFHAKRQKEELYDIENDPDELNNLASKEEYRKIRLGLKNKLFQWMKKTKDPLLKGYVLPKQWPHIACSKECFKKLHCK